MHFSVENVLSVGKKIDACVFPLLKKTVLKLKLG